MQRAKSLWNFMSTALKESRFDKQGGTVPDLRKERSGVPALVIARDRVPKQSQSFGTSSELGLSPPGKVMSFDTNDETDDLIFLSALNHYLYCPRRCALIHIEQLWDENLFTAEGRIMHDKVDTANRESRGNVRIEYGVPIRSLRLGLIGKADVVEFHKMDDGTWIPFTVEYKRGKPKMDDCDKVQLCAQAICLEEMLNVKVKSGALFYGRTRRREDVFCDDKLRMETEDAAMKVHTLIESGTTPKAEYSKKCKKCSLYELCMPKVSSKASNYLMKVVGVE